MGHKLSYRERLKYSSSDIGIAVPVVLSFNGQSIQVDNTKLDTGASHCIFERGYGGALGLAIEKGARQNFSTASGSFTAFGHTVFISAMGFSLEALVYFAQDESYRRNVLGRHGWINKLRLGLIDYDCELYASHYDDPQE